MDGGLTSQNITRQPGKMFFFFFLLWAGERREEKKKKGLTMAF
jgi:hypothetical protein